MKIYTQKEAIQEVVERWNKQYSYLSDPKHNSSWDQKNREVTKALNALSQSEWSPETFKRIIGNSSWTEAPTCCECQKQRWPVVRMGHNYEGYDYYCKPCINLAKETLDATD